MRWRSEPNNYMDSKVRTELTIEQRDIYHCLRSLAGCDTGRWGWIERNELNAFTIKEIAVRISVDEELIADTIDRLIDLNILTAIDGHYYFVDWNEEQAIKQASMKPRKPRSPEEQEYYEMQQLTKLADKHPEVLNKLVDKRVASALSALKEGE